ncbi:MAG: GAF domain-containing protein [Myxococcaceae bacterium]
MDPSVLDSSPLATFVMRAQMVRYANDALLKLLGRTRGEVLGQPFTAFVAPQDVARVLERHERRRRDEPVPPEYEVCVLVSDGTPRTVEVIVSSAGEDTVVHLRDVSARAGRRHNLVELARLGVALQAERTGEAVYRRMTEGLAALGLSVTLLRSAGKGLSVRLQAGPPRMMERIATELREAPLPEIGPWSPLAEAAWRDGSAFTDDAPLDFAQFVGGEPGERLRRVAAELGLFRAAAVRIDVSGTPADLVVLSGEWLTQEELPSVQLFCAQVSSALDAAHTIASLSRRNAELASLNRLAMLAGTTPDLSTLFTLGSQEIQKVTGSVAVALYLIEESGQAARLAHQLGGSKEAGSLYARVVPDRPDSLLWKVVNRGESRVWSRMDYPEPTRSVIARMGQEVIASVPLVAHSTVVGVMNVAFDTPRTLEPGELELLEAMGSHFAAAVLTQRLLEDLRGRVSDLGLLHEVGRSLVATLETGEVLDLGVRNLARSVGVSEAYLLLEDPQAKALIVRAVSGAHPELLGRPFPLSPPDGSVAACAFHTGAPVVIEDGENDPRVDQAVRAHTGGRAYLALPLVVRDKTIGAVVILDPLAPRRYSPQEVERASAIANQLAVAVENARLYHDLRASYEQLALAQAQSVRKERLAALGELSAVVAHEVRNPLGVIFNSLGALKRLLKPKGDAELLLSIVGQEAERLNRIVGDLLDFARPSTPALRPEHLAPVLDDAVAAALGTSRPGVRLVRDYDPALPRVPMDERLFRQAVVNIALNALQAMPNGGELTVRARTEDGPRGVVARIELSDNGPGMSSEARAHLFEPFFTTKATGTGLGLALVKRIIDDHRGEVVVTSEPGSGTTFTLRLPLQAAPA